MLKIHGINKISTTHRHEMGIDEISGTENKDCICFNTDGLPA
jgi:hypothetical protein